MEKNELESLDFIQDAMKKYPMLAVISTASLWVAIAGIIGLFLPAFGVSVMPLWLAWSLFGLGAMAKVGAVVFAGRYLAKGWSLLSGMVKENPDEA